jgi:hypothetical protein
MAQEITAPLHGDFISGPGMVLPLADQTGTTASQQFIGTGGRVIAAKWVSAMVFFKTFVVGTGTVYPIFALEAGDDTGFTLATTRRIAQFQPSLVEAIGAIPAANPRVAFFLEGFCPDAGKSWVRVKTLASGTSTFIYDIIFAGA